MSKRSYEEAFQRRELNNVRIGDICVKIDMFKVETQYDSGLYGITTSGGNTLKYSYKVITKRATSATEYDEIKDFTKTEFIELFASLSVNDVWSAEYLTFDKDKTWPLDLAEKIQGMERDKAAKYIKENFQEFGKDFRVMIGHKIEHNSINNYYTVRDLTEHFKQLEYDPDEAFKKSIRNLDVNTIQYLIFNGTKYYLKE